MTISTSPRALPQHRYRPPRVRRRDGVPRYPSADAMLERYQVLQVRLSAVSQRWPDPKRTFSGQRSTESPQERFGVELGDIARCIQQTHLDRDERQVLRHLYRFRGRWCRKCCRAFGEVFASLEVTHLCCPKCGATKRDGWVWESFPTVSVLAEELSYSTKRKWSYGRVYRLRETAYLKLEVVMAERGMLGVRA